MPRSRRRFGRERWRRTVGIIDSHALTAVAVQTVADIERDPHWQARQLLVDVPDGTRHGAHAQRRAAPVRDARPDRLAGGALGEHNQDVFGTELGLSCDELTRLQHAGVI